jgi:hypothetical protein
MLLSIFIYGNDDKSAERLCHGCLLKRSLENALVVLVIVMSSHCKRCHPFVWVPFTSTTGTAMTQSHIQAGSGIIRYAEQSRRDQ